MSQNLDRFLHYAYSYPATLYNSYHLATGCILNGIPGDFVEMGVAAGAQILAFQEANVQTGANRTIRGFDSFIGIPLAGPNDTQQPGIGDITHDKYRPEEELLVSSGVTVHSLEQVLDHFRLAGFSTDNVVFYPGWFQHTLPTAVDEIEQIAILRLDGDLYSSTEVSLKYLYDKVVPGGYVIIDDYGSLSGCRDAVHDFFAARGEELPELTDVDGYSVVYFKKN